MSPLRLPLPLLLMTATLSGRPAAALSTPPPSPPPDAPPDGLDHQLQLLLEEAEGGVGNASWMSTVTTTMERRRLCTESADSQPPASHCRVSWDEALCWPASPPGKLVLIPCFKEFRGTFYPDGDNNTASRYCRVNGTWEEKVNYSACINVFSEVIPAKLRRSEHTTIIYLIGYSLSLVTLSVATWIFAYCRDLHCLRNKIHANLFITYILTDSLWIITLSLKVGVDQSTFASCVMATMLHYCLVTTFFWMFVEGHYLYMLVVQTFSADKIRCRLYVLIGWGVPLLVMITWALVKARTSRSSEQRHLREAIGSETAAGDGLGDGWSSQQDSPALDEYGAYSAQCRWLMTSNWDWIYIAPALLVLGFNFIFLVRIMWVLITKLRSTNSAETQQYKKATKALLVLLPLLGIPYILVIAPPTENGVLEQVFAYLQPILVSTQGLAVSLIYCFFNSEVRASIKAHYQRWNMKRSVAEESGNSQRTFPASSRRSSATETTYMVTDQAGHGCSRLQRLSSHGTQAGRNQLDTV